MKLLKLFPVLLCLLSLVMLACEADPWIQRGNPVDTDHVVITKVTAYGKQADGVSPYKGQVGAVIMSHKVHEKQGLACVDCHHKNGNDDRIKQCAKCHNGQAGYEIMHGLCVDCHIQKKEGPQKCMECH
ncbi:MAG: hypothetical protein CVV49_19425 [Spirochaetae bacterium HGW-Spirochaetae-5]|nr:MAG: hypothetical protein CVV49_19425 [Spirochaetae bacterium HGW-Spirochaetae-5]